MSTKRDHTDDPRKTSGRLTIELRPAVKKNGLTTARTICNHMVVRSGQVRSECLTYRFRASCWSVRLSRAQVPAFASSSVRERHMVVGASISIKGLTCRFRASCYSARLSWALVLTWVMVFGVYSSGPCSPIFLVFNTRSFCLASSLPIHPPFAQLCGSLKYTNLLTTPKERTIRGRNTNSRIHHASLLRNQRYCRRLIGYAAYWHCMIGGNRTQDATVY